MINILGSYFMKSIIDFYIPQKLKTWVSMISMALIASYIMQQILSYLQKYFLILLVKTYSINILSPYIKHLFRLPITFLKREEQETYYQDLMMQIQLLML